MELTALTAQAQTAQAVQTQRRLETARLRGGGTAELARVRKRDRKGENMCLEGEKPSENKTLPREGLVQVMGVGGFPATWELSPPQ